MPGAEPLRPAGLRLIVAPDAFAGMRETHGRVIAAIVDAVAELHGVEAARALADAGLGMLHTVAGPSDIAAIRDRVLDALRAELLELGVRIGRRVLHWDDDFFLDDYLIVRINFPYGAARHGARDAENPGIGRLSPQVRALAAARRARDPVYQPAAYHRDHSPAAWAHGPHIDSWSGHARDGVNLWWAMSDVPADAGMVMYPETAESTLQCDPASLYVRAGMPLPKPTPVPLAPGEMLIFDPEVLHGTHLNLSGRTRVAVSLRLNAHEPRFDPACFYAREFWRRASDLEAGIDRVLHLAREDHLGPALAAAPAPTAPAIPFLPAQRDEAGDGFVLGDAAALVASSRAHTAIEGCRVLLAHTAQGMFAVDAACPHYGLDMTDGALDGHDVFCPGCAVRFDLRTGASASPELRVRTYALSEDAGILRLHVR